MNGWGEVKEGAHPRNFMGQSNGQAGANGSVNAGRLCQLGPETSTACELALSNAFTPEDGKQLCDAETYVSRSVPRAAYMTAVNCGLLSELMSTGTPNLQDVGAGEHEVTVASAMGTSGHCV